MLRAKGQTFIRLSPLLLIFIVLPLLVYYIPFRIPELFQGIYMSETYSSSFFFIKVFVYILITIYMVILLVVLRKHYVLHRTKTFNICYFMSGVFILFTLVSDYFSPYKEATILGAPSRLEGTLVIICYFITFIVAYVSIQSAKDLKLVFYAFVGMSMVQVFIGITQFIGYDLLSWGGIREFTSSAFAADQYYSATPLPFFLSTKLKAWTGTIGNPNYSGSFAALGLPLFTILCLSTNNHLPRRLYFMGAMAHLTITFLCGSRAGLVGIFLSIIILILLVVPFMPKAINYLRQCFVKAPIRFSCKLMLLSIYICFLAVVSGTFGDLNRMFNDIKQVVSTPPASTQPTYSQLQGIEFTPYTLAITSIDDVITVSFAPDKMGNLILKDAEGTPIIHSYEDPGSYRILEGGFEGYIFKLSQTDNLEDIRIEMGRGNSFEDFQLLCSIGIGDLGVGFITHPYTKESVEIKPIPKFGFEGRERIGSGRGYIWSRSIPLLLDTLLLGYGSDSFVLVYPQEDFIGKVNFLSNPWIVVDKPHNTYLQLWINHGFIAFIAFVILNLTYLIQSIRLFGFKKMYTSQEGLGLSMMLAIVAYLGASFFNDTTISVTPMYFALLGMGVAYNRLYSSLQAG